MAHDSDGAFPEHAAHLAVPRRHIRHAADAHRPAHAAHWAGFGPKFAVRHAADANRLAHAAQDTKTSTYFAVRHDPYGGRQPHAAQEAEPWQIHSSQVGNSLSGTIPTEVGNLTQLTRLYINSQRLSGTIPTALFQNTLLSGLSLHENSLSGTLPTQLGLLTRLRQLTIHKNRLSGTLVTEIGGLTRLNHLDLHANSFSGSLPTELYLLNEDYPLWSEDTLWSEGGVALGCIRYGNHLDRCESKCQLTINHCDDSCRSHIGRQNTNNFDCPVPKLPAACAQFDIGVCDCYTDDNRTCGTTYALAIGIPSLAVIAIAMYILRRACRKGACRKGKDPSSVEGVTEDRNTSDVRL